MLYNAANYQYKWLKTWCPDMSLQFMQIYYTLETIDIKLEYNRTNSMHRRKALLHLITSATYYIYTVTNMQHKNSIMLLDTSTINHTLTLIVTYILHKSQLISKHAVQPSSIISNTLSMYKKQNWNTWHIQHTSSRY